MQQSINRALLIAGTALFAVLPAAAKDDGSVTFQGQVVNAACSVSMDSQDQIVHMGQVRNSQFIAAGDWAKPVPFFITLEACDTSVSQRAGVLFSGESDGNDPQVFRAGYGPGAATGIGIGLFDAMGNLVKPDTAPPWYRPLQDGENRLSYIARYRATEDSVNAGTANAQVWFIVLYQ